MILFTKELWDVDALETPTSTYNHCQSVVCTVEIGPYLHFQNVGEVRPLQADLSGRGWGIAGQAMRAAAVGERAS
jgi:hypothetical protein